MQNWDDFYPNTFLRAADLNGRRKTCTISGITTEELGDDRKVKPVLSFRETQKKLALNKTKSTALSLAFGPSVEACIGQRIELFPSTVFFGGRQTDCIRISIPEQAPPMSDPFEDVA